MPHGEAEYQSDFEMSDMGVQQFIYDTCNRAMNYSGKLVPLKNDDGSYKMRVVPDLLVVTDQM